MEPSDRAGRLVVGRSHRMEHPRPRRPNADTLSYLTSLPLELELSNQQVDEFLAAEENGRRDGGARESHGEDEDPAAGEFPALLGAALSAIEEVRNEVASLAGDERGAECVELLARVACPHSELASRILLAAVVDYAVHLATHRYGSHVLQTILQLSASSSPDTATATASGGTTHSDLALHGDSPIRGFSGAQSLPSLLELLGALQSTLEPCLTDLSVHLCGSHVVRTLLCVCGGVTLVTPSQSVRRGKVKAKKKRKPDAAPRSSNGLGHTSVVISLDPHSRLVSTAEHRRTMRGYLEELTRQLTGSGVQPPGELQEMACHASAGPLLATLLRVLTWSHSLEPLSNHGQHVAGDDSPVEPTFLPGSAAHSLAQRLLCWKEDASEEDGQPWAGDVIYEYSGKSSGSHVMETILRLAHDDFHALMLQVGRFLSPPTLQEYVENNVSNFVVQTALSTLRTAPQAANLLSVVSPLIRSGLVLDAEKKRRGVLWRAVEAAATHRVRQKELIQDVICGFEGLQSTSGSSQSKRIKNLKGCIPLLLRVTVSEGRLTVDVPGAQCVRCLLGFEPELCGDALRGLLQLSPLDLEGLAKDGIGSRCVWDGILDNRLVQSDDNFRSATKQLAEKLQGRWVSIGSDRIGQHVVRKLFACLSDMDARKQLVMELSSGKMRLNGCAMGRSVMEACYVHELMAQGEREWVTLVKKVLHKATLAKEIIEEVDAGTSEGQDRKRRNKSDEAPRKKKDRKTQKPSTMSVDSIMRTLAIPGPK